ncbi:hypothetical protein MLD38_029305 [Melastoma candidum]|uniref:Uncharacterized protein n=1 Tax=Melastoma candidum TaxID=119954 RepID=A0ACB9N5H4_9MYRT|nr:hypothetical protein MLD38_029305 [Melastoma candidum]
MGMHHTLAISFGVMGNIVSFITFLAPMPTFYKIIKLKSTEGFQSIPYVVSLLSAMLLMYYGLLKGDMLLITINAIGCAIETTYVAAYLLYASKGARVRTMMLLASMNVVGYGTMLSMTFILSKGQSRVGIVGWICMAFSLSVFAAPLCIVRKVIKTKSVEFMPLSLSVFLTLGAVVWFFYGFLLRDVFIAVPNILGFLFGVTQMVLYAIYRNKQKLDLEVHELNDLKEEIIDVVKLGAIVCQELNPVLAAQLKDVAISDAPKGRQDEAPA